MMNYFELIDWTRGIYDPRTDEWLTFKEAASRIEITEKKWQHFEELSKERDKL